jgi:hypothetical protein
VSGYREFLKQATKDYAPGLPSKGRVLPLPTASGQPWTFSVQQHDADRAGRHLDIRLTDSRGRAHSWALRGGLPAPGQKVGIHQQPTHRGSYAGWSGTIESGYGKGTVRSLRHEPVDVLESGKDRVSFVVPRGRVAEEMSIIRAGKGWLLVNHTTTQGKFPISHHKPKYREMAFEAVKADTPDTVLGAKIDGAHAIAFFEPGKHPRLFSYRQSKRNVPLEYTHKMGMGFRTARWPKGKPGMMVRGEVYAVDRQGKAVPENELGRLLNANVENAQALVKEKGWTMRFAPFQLEKVRGRPKTDVPYREQLEVLKTIPGTIPDTKLPTYALTPKAKAKLLMAIRSGKLKETSEGVVEWGPKGPTKAKIRPDFDVYVREVFQEGGGRKGMAGGFRYSLTPRGPIVGRVGTGFNHDLKRFMSEHPDKVKGLVARVKAQHQFASGALRAPAFKGWHSEKSGRRVLSVPEGVKQASWLKPLRRRALSWALAGALATSAAPKVASGVARASDVSAVRRALSALTEKRVAQPAHRVFASGSV